MIEHHDNHVIAARDFNELEMVKKPERDFLFVRCERGHDMHHVGGCNAGCAPDCHCSIPVCTCSRCGYCDYGHNDEAKQVKTECAETWCGCGRPATFYEDPCCDFSGTCEAPKDASGITNCIHCGKELHERGGQWWTWDADQYDNQRPQR